MVQYSTTVTNHYHYYHYHHGPLAAVHSNVTYHQTYLDRIDTTETKVILRLYLSS